MANQKEAQEQVQDTQLLLEHLKEVEEVSGQKEV